MRCNKFLRTLTKRLIKNSIKVILTLISVFFGVLFVTGMSVLYSIGIVWFYAVLIIVSIIFYSLIESIDM